MNIGEVVKVKGKVAICLTDKLYLTLNDKSRLEVVNLEGEEVEKLKYEHLTSFLRNRLLLLNHKYGGE